MSECICKTEPTREVPCPLTKEEHGILPRVEDISVPDKEGKQTFARVWWDATRSRQRAQYFHTHLEREST